MKRVILPLAVLALLGATAATARQQILKNGGYESADGMLLPTDWSIFPNNGIDVVQSSGQVYEGDFSVLCDTGLGNAFVGGYQDTKSVDENVRILMKAFAYNPSAAPLVGDDAAGIKLEFLPPEGLVIPDPEENLAFDDTQPDDTWVQVSLSTVVPADIDVARITVISFDETSINGPVWADLAYTELGTAPGTNQLLNSSFQDGGSGPDGMNPPWDEFAGGFSSARLNCFEVPEFMDGSTPSEDCQLKCSGISTSGVTQDIVVTPGETIDISCWFYSKSATPYAQGDAKAGVKVQWVAGAIPSPQIDVVANANPISGTTNVVTPASTKDVWNEVTIDYTIPNNNAAKLRGTFINAFGAGSQVYFDSFEMVLTNVFDGSDSDGDNDEDLLDIANLQRAYTGSGGGMVYGGLVFDHNEDDDVDASDSNFTLARMTGPNP